jgi:hypothetical protein
MGFIYPLSSNSPAPEQIQQHEAHNSSGASTHSSLRFGFFFVQNEPALRKQWSCVQPMDFKTCTGMLGYPVSFMAEYLNMSVEMVYPKDNDQLGRRMPNGSWTGATGDVPYIKYLLCCIDCTVTVHCKSQSKSGMQRRQDLCSKT